MPSLVFLGQRWHVGEDDLFLPMALAAVARVAIAATILTLGLLAKGLSSCDGRGLVLAYLTASVVACILAAISEIGIAIVALAGTITYTQPRARARRFLHVKTAVFSLQMALAVVGVFIAATLADTCGLGYVPNLLLAAVLVAAATQVLDCAGAGCCFATFSAGRAYEDLMEDVGADASGSSSGRRWQRRRQRQRRRRGVADVEAELENKCRAGCRALGACTCYIFGGGGPEADFQHVARVLARIFYTEEDLDVVPSDIAAGIVLLHHAQKSRELALRDDFETALREEGFGGRVGNAGGGYGGGHSPPPPDGSGGGGGGAPGEIPVPVAVAAIAKSVPLPERRRLHAKYFKASRGKVLDMNDAADRAALEEATHFARYACAVYGWMLHVFAHPLTGLSGIVSSACSRRNRRIQSNRRRRNAGGGGGGSGGGAGSGGGSRSGSRSPQAAADGVDSGAGGGGGSTDGGGSADERRALTRGDNCLAWHEAALLRAADVKDSELAFAHFGNDVRRTPYCIFVDHRWQCVVIAVRGTLSFEDCIVDAMAEPWSMEELGNRWGFDGKGLRAHKGILDRAEWVRQDLEDHGVLAGLLGPGVSSGGGSAGPPASGGCSGSDATGASTAATSVNDTPRTSGADASTPLRGWASSCRGYSLRVTGHSLGAGVAVLLTAMLRPRYNFARCVAVSPPGGLVSRESVAAQKMGEWCLVVVLNNDIVMRMSLQSLEKLRDDVLELVGRSKVSKLAVMRSALVSGRCAHRLDQYVAGPDSPPPHATPYLEQLERYKQRLASQRERSELAHLWPPGERILHLVKTDAERGGCCGRRVRRIYTPVWSPADHFQEIIIGRTTLTDHFPDNTLAALEEVRKDVLGEAP